MAERLGTWRNVARALGAWVVALLVGVPLVGIVVAIAAFVAPRWGAAIGFLVLVLYVPLAAVWAILETRRPRHTGRPLGRRSGRVARRLADEQVRAPGLDARIKY